MSGKKIIINNLIRQSVWISLSDIGNWLRWKRGFINKKYLKKKARMNECTWRVEETFWNFGRWRRTWGQNMGCDMQSKICEKIDSIDSFVPMLLYVTISESTKINRKIFNWSMKKFYIAAGLIKLALWKYSLWVWQSWLALA